MDQIKLTQYSHGAGCGCKISPQVLDVILKGNIAMPDNDKLIVGNHSKDDAAVLDMGNGTALISTTDFFMPIVDDPFNFGRIASANAIKKFTFCTLFALHSSNRSFETRLNALLPIYHQAPNLQVAQNQSYAADNYV